jgi:hypothetical protein
MVSALTVITTRKEQEEMANEFILQTIEVHSLTYVTGGEGQSWGAWLQERGQQVLNHFAPSWGVQGQTPTPGGGSAQYRGGDTPSLPSLPQLPAMRQQ